MAIKSLIWRLKYRLFRKFVVLFQWINRFKPPGLGGAGTYDIIKFFGKALGDNRFNMTAMAMSYRFFFAVFPALILVFTLVPYIPIENLELEVEALIATVVPPDSFGFVNHVVEEFFAKPSASVIYINIFLLLGSTLGGIRIMMNAFTKDSELFVRRNWFGKQILAFFIFLLLLVIFMLLVGGMIGIEFMIKNIQEETGLAGGWEELLLRIFNWFFIFLGIQVAVSVLFYLGPAVRKRFRFFSPGSISAGIMIVIAISAFRWFIVNFSDYNQIYGSLGAIMILMVWFYWLSIVLLTGSELNIAIQLAKQHHRKRITLRTLPEKKIILVKHEEEE